MDRVDPTTKLGKLLAWSSGETATDLHTETNWSRVVMDMQGFAPSAGAFLKPGPTR